LETQTPAKQEEATSKASKNAKNILDILQALYATS
jgi:hypothetical protein